MSIKLRDVTLKKRVVSVGSVVRDHQVSNQEQVSRHLIYLLQECTCVMWKMPAEIVTADWKVYSFNFLSFRQYRPQHLMGRFLAGVPTRLQVLREECIET
jgi:hypothetical protein